MLESSKLVAFIGVREAARARTFYRDTLGLRLVSEDGFALVFDAGGTMLRLTLVQAVAAAPYTVLGWEVQNIGVAVQELGKRDVRFERYDFMQQDELGVRMIRRRAVGPGPKGIADARAR